MWVRRASDREEMSRNLQEFLPKTELMREHAEHTAIALNPPFSRVRTAAREAAGASHRARSGGQRGPAGASWRRRRTTPAGSAVGRAPQQGGDAVRARNGGGQGRRRQAQPCTCERVTSGLPSSNTVSLECSGQDGREASGVWLL